MFPRGSEWRRWDLHLHTPETILNDQFGDWEEYLKTVEAHPQVKVLGITDYMSIANYSKLKSHKAGGRIANIDLLIPNIEFRIAPPTDKATAVNIHLLISPDDPQHEQEILNALARLGWEYGGRKYSCLPDQLAALGRAFDTTIKDEGAALRAGVTQFKVDFTGFRDWYTSEPWLRRNSLVSVAAGADGVSGFPTTTMRPSVKLFCSMIWSSAQPAAYNSGSTYFRQVSASLMGISYGSIVPAGRFAVQATKCSLFFL